MIATQLTTHELAENFALLEDWETRYAYLIDLGKRLPQFPADQKTDANLVRGCTSLVWMISEQKNDGKIHFRADSDAHIVRGLIALLQIIYDGQEKNIARNFPIHDYFAQLGLEEHLSPSRRNGFYAMVERIRSLASE